ncbi:MAG: hypothetical protein KGJ60_16005 [Verrucomicrobiota bacterium]|nr:hypothetical protein [Verrucomicrobiota bacterium]
MARTQKHDVISPYYPPRARWYSPVFHFAGVIRRGLAFDRIRLPKGITCSGLAGGFLIPGLGIYLRGPRLYGRIALLVCALLCLLFFMWLGYPLGNYAFGLLLSVHVTSLVYYCGPALVHRPFHHRVLFTLLALIAFACLFYSPLRAALQEHWLMPLRANGRVFVVSRLASPGDIHRGDWVAYALPGHLISIHGYQNVYGGTGLGLGPALATAGDRVEFSTNSFAVNGVRHPLLPHMPVFGSWVVPENHWFIWPEVSMSGHGEVGEAAISSTMLQMADVSETQFVGKPFDRWFWRKQMLP